MFTDLFKSVFASSTTTITVPGFLASLGTALVLGLLLAAAYTYKNKYTKSFLSTLALLPAVVCVVIMMVNGNVGTGIAVAGAFGLVRFRSAPGTAKEIGALFLAMGTGLIAGMGYIGYAVLFAVIMSGISMIYSHFQARSGKKEKMYKTIRITVPEDLNYEGMFEEVLPKYVEKYELKSVKTTNMGSLFKLHYDVEMKAEASEKEMIDMLRERNGNLEISISVQETPAIAEL